MPLAEDEIAALEKPYTSIVRTPSNLLPGALLRGSSNSGQRNLGPQRH